MDDLFAGIPSEGEPVIPAGQEEAPETNAEEVDESPSQEGDTQPEDETPEESPSEEVEAEETESNTSDEDKDVPLHKHPRFKSKVKELDETRAELEALKRDQSLQDTVSKLSEKVDGLTPKPNEPIPDWFKQLYGEDQDTWNQYQEEQIAYEAGIIRKAKEEVLNEIETKSKSKEDNIAKANEWIDSELEQLSLNHGLDLSEGKNERNEILKVARDYNPTAEDGSVDFEKAYELWKALKPSGVADATIEERKKIASSTSASKSGDVGKSKIKTSHDFKNRGWDQIRADTTGGRF
jgi:hypothetical protein|tara:strand:+ start:4827 stop:5708 length:882 start_codon:yes stop_codon:yes gene_type:complete